MKEIMQLWSWDNNFNEKLVCNLSRTLYIQGISKMDNYFCPSFYNCETNLVNIFADSLKIPYLTAVTLSSI